MEELLNKLIEKGWKPMWHKPLTDEIKKKVKVERYNRKPMSIVIKNGRKYADDYYSLREIVSKESGLWQFVCENKMVELDTESWDNDGYYRCYYNCDGYPKDYYFDVERDDYRFRLLESSLKDESELEDFLLQNIKVD